MLMLIVDGEDVDNEEDVATVVLKYYILMRAIILPPRARRGLSTIIFWVLLRRLALLYACRL